MFKFRVLSDLHINHRPYKVVPLADDHNTVLIVAGDLATARSNKLAIDFLNENADRFLAVVSVLGNHDYWGSNFNYKTFTVSSIRDAVKKNVIILEKETITINGIKIGGATLWTDVNKGDPVDMLNLARYTNDIYSITGMTAKDWYDEHTNTKNWITDTKVDILVTHYVPSTIFTPTRYSGDKANCAFNSDVISGIPPESMPKVWVFGHTHTSFNQKIGDTTFICNPRGYGGENALNFEENRVYAI